MKQRIQRLLLALGLVAPLFAAMPVRAVSQPFTLQPWEFVGAEGDCGTGSPAGNDANVTAEWVAEPGADNPVLKLEKLGELSDCIAAGADVVSPLEGQDISSLNQLSFEYKDGAYCGAGAPRFNVTVAGSDYFLGCAHGVMSTGSVAGWTKVTFDTSGTFGGVTLPVSGNIDNIEIVFDEIGTTLLDNVGLNNDVVGAPAPQTPTVGPCEQLAVVRSTNLSGWDFSETRATGHYELVNDGLRIWTEGMTSTDKAAGYYATNFPLSGLGDQTIDEALDYDATTGIEPGLQLVVDFDNNGTPDGILVGEAVYGNTWWLSNGSAQFVKDDAPNTGGGYGSNWFGTANEWLASFPDARVKAIGYSLGSGVLGDGVIRSINLGCVNYTFDLPMVLSNKDQCKKDGWKNSEEPVFKNQGDCVSYFASKGKAKGNPTVSNSSALRF